MLSFEISVIDVVLLLVVLVLLLLFVTQKKSQPVTDIHLRINPKARVSEKLKASEESFAESRLNKPSADGFRGCVHQFGHLRCMPQNTPVPEECFGCPKVLRCMFKNE